MTTQELLARLEPLRAQLTEIEQGGVEPSEEARYNAVRNRIRDVEQRLHAAGGAPQKGGGVANGEPPPASERREQSLETSGAPGDGDRRDRESTPAGHSKNGPTIGPAPNDEPNPQCGPVGDLDRRDPADPRFWDQVRNDARSVLQGWLSGQLLNALTEFETHMSAQSSSSNDGAVVIRLLMSGIAFAVPGGAGAMAAQQAVAGFVDVVSKVTGIVETALTFNGSAPARVRYNDFVNRLHRQVSELDSSVRSGRHEALQHLSELERSETDQNRNEIRRSAVEQLNSAACQLPDRGRLLRNMVTAWVDGAEDGPDAGDWGEHDAGYIYCEAELTWGVGHLLGEVRRDPSIMLFNRKDAHIDDVANQAGTIESVRQAFGANTFLDMLPFPMTIEVRYMGPDFRETHRYEKTGRSRDHLRGWRPARGASEEWMRAFLSHAYRPKVSDLAED